MATSAVAEESNIRVTRYDCATLSSETSLILPVPKQQRAEVKVLLHGKPHAAVFFLEGVTKVWAFESDSNLQVHLEPDLTASYFDFTCAEEGEQREAESTFICSPIRSDDSKGPDQDLTRRQDDGDPDSFESQNLASKPTVIGDDYVLVVGVAPIYPAAALSHGLEGHVDLSFTVTSVGIVADPVVIQSTDSVFERAAIRAILNYKYKPRVVDGVPVNTPNVETRMSFEIEK